MSRPATAAVRLLTGEREPVRLATTADILLHGLQAIDGVPAEIGDRVLVKDQADPTQNGIYTASAGDWFRAADARTTRTVQKGTTVHIQIGSVNADRVFEFTADEPAVGADAITIAASVPPDIADVVEEVEALRDETQALKDAAETSAGQASASAAASAANASQTTADRAATNSDAVAAAAAVVSAQAARDASFYGKGIFPTTAAAIGFGVVGNGAITAGSGGANGTFDLAFTGGTGSGAAGRFVVAGGALTQILITAPGSYTVAPTLSFAASAGLAGAAAVAVMGRNVDVGEYFWTEVSAGLLGLFRVDAGPVATDIGVRSSTASIVTNVDALSRIEGLAVTTIKLTEGTGSVAPTCFRTYTFSTGVVVEHVVTARASERRLLQLLSNGPAVYTANFDLSDGTCTGTGPALTSFSMIALGGGEYECRAVVTPTANGAANVQTRFSPAGVFPFTGDGASGVYVRNIVLRLPSTTTNLFPSSDPTNAVFTKTNCTAAAATVPEVRVVPQLQALVDVIDVLVNGRLTADKIIEQSGSGSPSVYQAIAWVIGQTFVWDVYAQKAERTRLNLFSNGACAFDCTFDLAGGTASGSGAAFGTVSTQAIGANWYRCRVTGTANGTGIANVQHRVFPAAGGHPYVGDGVSGLGLQSSSLSINGGANILNSPRDFSSAAWIKAAGMPPVAANTIRYVGALDPSAIDADADDGRAALVGKKWTLLGSSITAQAFYRGPLAVKTGMVPTNLAYSGGSLGIATNGHYGSQKIYDQIALIPVDAEIITLEPGPNNFGAADVVLGDLGDQTLASGFTGAMVDAFKAMRLRAPIAKIICLGTYSGGPGHATHRLFRTNSQGNTLDQFMRREREVCEMMGIGFIDVGGGSGIGYLTSTLYMSDELHLNSVGGERYASFVADKLRALSRVGFFGT
ncbi:hypothetical protein NKJ48_26930 [Mesorhizobium sp. M0114]|uniref:phage head spike fiber domain-containing protein n=1 Tax=unclassified Mesorhizobium TaxID=325217 RepID=UPI00333AF414